MNKYRPPILHIKKFKQQFSAEAHKTDGINKHDNDEDGDLKKAIKKSFDFR